MWFYVSRIIAYVAISLLAGVFDSKFKFHWIMLVMIYTIPKIALFLLVVLDISDQPRYKNVVINFDKALKFYYISKHKYNSTYLLKLRYINATDDTAYNLYFKSLIDYIRYWILVMNSQSHSDETVYENYIEAVKKDVDKFHKKTMKQLEKVSRQAQKEIELTLEHNRTAK